MKEYKNITKESMCIIYSEFSLSELEKKLEYVKYLTDQYNTDLAEEIEIIERFIENKRQ